MANCSDENIHLFVKYVQGELSRQEECIIDSHIQSCKDCLFNFAYIEEILITKQKLSTDERALFIKYLSDPICQSEREKLKQEILSEIRDIQREEIKQQILNQLNPLSSNNAAHSALKPTKSGSANISNKKKLFVSKYIAATLALTFLGLSTGVYLMLNKSGQIFSFSNFLSFTPSKHTTNDTYHKFTNHISVNTNLYQELDLAIDKYLERQDPSYIKKAEDIAKEIERKYGDKYGVDLVDYYISCPKSNHLKLLSYRRELNDLITVLSGDDYQTRLRKANELVKQFLLVENTIESYKVKALATKLYVMTFDDSGYKELIKEAIPYVNEKKYLFLKLQFCLWQAKYQSNTAIYLEAEEKLTEVINLSKQLENQETQASASMSLAGLYHINNKDEEALELAQSTLLLNNSRKEVIISLLHISGLSAFKLHLEGLSEQYFQQAIDLSKTNKNNFLLALSYTFLATTISENSDFIRAEEIFAKASDTAELISDSTSRIDLFCRIDGYLAKSKLQQGDYLKAVSLYQSILSRVKSLQTQSNLELSQLNLGLALALEKTGNKDSIDYKTVAAHLLEVAQAKHEVQNCLLSFLPAQCN